VRIYFSLKLVACGSLFLPWILCEAGFYLYSAVYILMKNFLLAYFVAIKGEKNGIYILFECLCMFYSAFISQICLLCLCLYCCCCYIYFATILGLCRCCHGCCNILLLLMMIWEYVLSTLYCACSLLMFSEELSDQALKVLFLCIRSFCSFQFLPYACIQGEKWNIIVSNHSYVVIVRGSDTMMCAWKCSSCLTDVE